VLHATEHAPSCTSSQPFTLLLVAVPHYSSTATAGELPIARPRFPLPQAPPGSPNQSQQRGRRRRSCRDNQTADPFHHPFKSWTAHCFLELHDNLLKRPINWPSCSPSLRPAATSLPLPLGTVPSPRRYIRQTKEIFHSSPSSSTTEQYLHLSLNSRPLQRQAAVLRPVEILAAAEPSGCLPSSSFSSGLSQSIHGSPLIEPSSPIADPSRPGTRR